MEAACLTQRWRNQQEQEEEEEKDVRLVWQRRGTRTEGEKEGEGCRIGYYGYILLWTHYVININLCLTLFIIVFKNFQNVLK